MIENVKENSQKGELRDRIIGAASKTLTAHGIKGVTMDDIAASLSISKHMLYEVFQDRENLLIGCILKRQKEVNTFLTETLASSENVPEVIFVCYQRSIETFHQTSRRSFEDIKKYPKVRSLLRNYRERDSGNTIEFFKMSIKQGVFRDDVNFTIVNLLVHEQLDPLMNTNICNKYSSLEVYEAIMFTYIHGISTEKKTRVLEGFIAEYKKQRIH